MIGIADAPRETSVAAVAALQDKIVFDPNPPPLPDRFPHRHGGTVVIRMNDGQAMRALCAEMAQTAEHLIVVGRGRLLADVSLTEVCGQVLTATPREPHALRPEVPVALGEKLKDPARSLAEERSAAEAEKGGSSPKSEPKGESKAAPKTPTQSE